MSTTPVSDEVWNQLDRDAVRPSRRMRRFIAAVAAVATFATIVVVFGFVSGLFRPSVWLETRWIDHIDRSAHTFNYTFAVHNTDWVDEKLTGVTSTDTGSGPS